MTKLINFLANGCNVIVDSYTSRRDYVSPSTNGFAMDQVQLRGDVIKVSGDIKKAMRNYGGTYRITRNR